MMVECRRRWEVLLLVAIVYTPFLQKWLGRSTFAERLA